MPIIAYKQEGFAMFDEMVERIQERTIAMLLKAQLEVKQQPVQRVYPTAPQSAPQPQQAPAEGQAQTAQSAPAPSQTLKDNEVQTPQALPSAVNVDALKTSGDTKFNPATLKKTREPGRNDPCPCGSGKKYKDCCYWKYHK